MSTTFQTIALTKSYGDNKALNSVSLALQPGTVTTLLGPNGSGKTTFIRTILGLQEKDSGTIFMNEQECTMPYPKTIRQKFLYIPDDPMVMEYLTGKENIEYMCGLFQSPLSGREIDEILRKYGLYEAKDKLARNYSRGMKQKLCLSYMEIYSPEILILDEPTNGLDVLAIHQLEEFLKELSRQGMTILIATHDMSFCRTVSDRIAAISKGTLLKTQNTEWYIHQYGSMENAAYQLLSSGISPLS